MAGSAAGRPGSLRRADCDQADRSRPRQSNPCNDLETAVLGLQRAGKALILPILPDPPDRHVEQPTPEIITYLTNVRIEHAKADALLGPRYLIPTVQSQMPLIEQLCQSARGSERE